jgi:hypothetical protein
MWNSTTQTLCNAVIRSLNQSNEPHILHLHLHFVASFKVWGCFRAKFPLYALPGGVLPNSRALQALIVPCTDKDSITQVKHPHNIPRIDQTPESSSSIKPLGVY